MSEAQIARLIGGAGTGKTTELLRIMEQVVERGIDPRDIGFVSFTRAARQEAAKRAATKFAVPEADLLQRGWFRTIHSVAYQSLGCPQGLLCGDSESGEWLREHVSPQLAGGTGSASASGDASEALEQRESDSPATTALSLWSVARNRLEPLSAVYRAHQRRNPDLPPLVYCERLAKRYEEAKALHSRLDFVDTLLSVAGLRCSPEHGVDTCTPRGDLPNLPVWFFDEQQDASALLDAVSRRLVAQPAVRWAYVVGDMFQSIYSFAGASPDHFCRWEVAKERIMPQTWRCPEPIHRLGEACLRPCSDYWDRGIAAAPHEGSLHRTHDVEDLVREISPDESWLLIARTHYLASAYRRALDDAGLPWSSTQGGGGWAAPARSAALLALCDLERGDPIMPDAWWRVTQLLPSAISGTTLLTRGTKTRWEDATYRGERTQTETLIDLATLSEHGGTEALATTIASGQWTSISEHAPAFRSAAARWGAEVVLSPRIQVGTIHSVKGAEADHVAVLTSTTGRIAHAREVDREIADEERRVAYVAVTRARRSLWLVGDPQHRRHKLDIPDFQG